MNSSGKPRSHSWWMRFLLLPLGLFYRLWTKSLRMDFLSPEDEAILKDSESPAIILLWHNRLFVAGEWHGRFRSSRKCYGLISGSRDGAWLESFYGWSGILAVRGSRNKRGASALRELARVIKNGSDIGITPDGSRGPCYEVKPGALLLAKISKSPILLLSFRFHRALRLSSWDSFFLPIPFSRVSASGKMIDSEALLSGNSPEEAARIVQDDLMSLTQD